MKKLLILLAAAFALAFVAESAMAQSLFGGRLRQNRDGVAVDSVGRSQQIPRTPRTEPTPPSTVTPSPAVVPQPSGGPVFSDDEIVVYRRTLCHGYREIGTICADSICCESPGEDYILVKKCFGRYCWVQVCDSELVGL